MSSISLANENKHQTNSSTDKTLNYAEILKPIPVELETSPLGSLSSSSLGTQHESRDILDIQKLADDIADARRDRISRYIDEAEMRQYIPLVEADFEAIRETDRLLEQAYNLYFTRGLSKDRRLKKKTKAMIARLESKPHFYCPYEREESTEIHVTRWLNAYTANPEEELFGFTSRDPYEPKRVVPEVAPRAVISDTNVVLGKRKRARDDEQDLVGVSMSSSDSRLFCEHGNRPKKVRKSL
ncbi:uncharacterized protein LOC132719045 [Ruditapes philippinarum]|uniref:uncharacterized protein LOC132719045 n=1 Tax=Ruditapes philippinarum TaxID=129788 RepID=UPI00295B55F1|nr:uncharacterized protein LOC132719045 [Ruditapes philippinarum]